MLDLRDDIFNREPSVTNTLRMMGTSSFAVFV